MFVLSPKPNSLPPVVVLVWNQPSRVNSFGGLTCFVVYAIPVLSRH